MRVSLLWSSPAPERTIVTAMRRCYSTKPIEEIERELEQKGVEYWKFLLTKALQDKSLDVLEHFTMTFLLTGVEPEEAGELALRFAHLRLTRVKGEDWLLSLNARTLLEMSRNRGVKTFVQKAIEELDAKKVCPLFNELAFGDRVSAR